MRIRKKMKVKMILAFIGFNIILVSILAPFVETDDYLRS